MSDDKNAYLRSNVDRLAHKSLALPQVVRRARCGAELANRLVMTESKQATSEREQISRRLIITAIAIPQILFVSQSCDGSHQSASECRQASQRPVEVETK